MMTAADGKTREGRRFIERKAELISLFLPSPSHPLLNLSLPSHFHPACSLQPPDPTHCVPEAILAEAARAEMDDDVPIAKPAPCLGDPVAPLDKGAMCMIGG
jgi:hypothetical protein